MKIHFISGLPRSGSTLLAALLRQNPVFHASISTGVADMFHSLIRSMSFSEHGVQISDQQRRQVLRSVVEGYYHHLSSQTVVFDTHRAWCQLLPTIADLFPSARVICCVRNVAQILDSVERIVQRNANYASKLFTVDGRPEATQHVYQRVEVLMKGLVGSSLCSLRQAWYSEQSQRLIAIPYDSLAERPAETISRLYSLLGMAEFSHDFDNVEYDEPEFDRFLGLPGLHRVVGPVEPRRCPSILPSDLFKRYDQEFWAQPEENPRGVTIL